MATIRKRLGKWQVQIRRKNYPLTTNSFIRFSREKFDGSVLNNLSLF